METKALRVIVGSLDSLLDSLGVLVELLSMIGEETGWIEVEGAGWCKVLFEMSTRNHKVANNLTIVYK